MKRFIVAGSIFAVGLLFAGCQSQTAATPPANQPVAEASVKPGASPEVNASPTVKATPKATPVVQSADDKALGVIDNELNQLDSAKDFPVFNQSDFE